MGRTAAISDCAQPEDAAKNTMLHVTIIARQSVRAVAVAMILGLAWWPPAAAQTERTVEVAPSDAQDLYAKLADLQYAGHTLLLSGTYVLTAEGNGAWTRGYIELGDRSL